MMTFIFLAIVIYLLYKLLKTIITKPFNGNKLTIIIVLILVSLMGLLSFFNTEHSLTSIILNENKSKGIEVLNGSSTTSFFYDQSSFNICNFKNKLEIPIPNYLELKDNDETSEFFRMKDEIASQKKNISLAGIGFTALPKVSNLEQNNLSQISDKEMNNFLEITEKQVRESFPAWGLTEFVITNSSITSATTNKNCNYIIVTYELENQGREAIIELLFIPTKKEMLRVLQFYYPEIEDDFKISRENIKLLNRES
jgi:hypothetical protein